MNTFKRSNSVVVVRNKQSEQQQPQQIKLAPLRAFQRLKRVFSSSSSASAKNNANNANCNSAVSSSCHSISNNNNNNNSNNSVCSSPQHYHHTRLGSSHSRSSSVSSHVSAASSADDTCTNYSVSRPSSPVDFESDNEYLIYHNNTVTLTSNNNNNNNNKMLPPLAHHHHHHRPSSTTRMRPPTVTVNKPALHPMAVQANKQQPMVGLLPNRSQTPTLVSNAKRSVVARTVSEVPCVPNVPNVSNVPAAVVAAPYSASASAFTPESNETMMSSSSSSTLASLSLLFPPSGYDFSIAQIQDAIETIAAEVIDMVPRLKTTDPGYNEFGRDPSFVARSFAEGFITRSRTSPLCVLVGFFYLKQLLARHPKLKISSNNASRLVLVACAAAAKFVDDVSMRYTNEHWIRIGGGGWLTLQKFNNMEREFMGLMDWNLSIKPVAFQQFCAQYGLGVCIPNQGMPWSQPSCSPVLSR